MTETIKPGEIVRVRGIRSPAMLVTKLHLQNDESDIADLLWFDANMNARQVTLESYMLEHVPVDG